VGGLLRLIKETDLMVIKEPVYLLGLELALGEGVVLVLKLVTVV
jgi:hypothetical protein